MSTGNAPWLVTLAPARLQRYKTFLKLMDQDEVARAYVWNSALAAVLAPLLGVVELQLRDAIHGAMSQQFAPAPIAGASGYPWYDDQQASHYSLSGDSRKKVDNLLNDGKTGLRKAKQPSPDDVIASLTLGFWTNLFRTFSPVEAPRIIPAIFPNHFIRTAGRWGNKQVRQDLKMHLQVFSQLRNRIAHHEPLFKFRHKSAYPRNVHHGLSNLRDCVDEILTISAWIDPAYEVALRQSWWFIHFWELSEYASFDDWVNQAKPPPCVYPI